MKVDAELLDKASVFFIGINVGLLISMLIFYFCNNL